jgi:hypothetical protein
MKETRVGQLKNASAPGASPHAYLLLGVFSVNIKIVPSKVEGK